MKARTKAPHHLVALGAAAVMGIYSAGYLRTRAAAARFSDAPTVRRPILPAMAVVAGPSTLPASDPSLAPAPSLRTGKPAASPDPVSPPAQGNREQPRREAAPKDATMDAVRGTRAVTPQAVKTAPVDAGASIAAATTTAPSGSPLTTPSAAPAAAATAMTAPAVAVPSAAPSAPAPAPAAPHYKDGTFLGWGSSRHGDIQASVAIAGGQITSATIVQCLTRYSCSVISPLPGQVVTRQSAEVDYVTGATQSANAFYDAVREALTKAAQ